ncbi:hypothetical protein PIB30_094523 [Stylosanthes scabra]|uniref:Uncharacterized protein n=1 Tax=Stylosanthes scabra TaxID=79078 RepID=A0ABU6QWI0_9FABA|nr:hypothetical protein [Stylosanthes scabra]
MLARKISASSPLPMDIVATKDYLRFIEKLERRPELSPLRSSQAFVSDSPRRHLSGSPTVITLRVMISLELAAAIVGFPMVLVSSPSLGDRYKVRPGNYDHSLVS